MRTHLLAGVAAGVALALAATPALAQVPSASAAATGLGDNYTAAARGLNAVAWNPAGLGMPGNPRGSYALGGRAEGGVSAVSLAEIARFEGALLPDAIRERWLAEIRARGSLSVRGDVGASPFAVSAGRLAFQVGTQVHGIGEIAPDAAELLLFGNAGATGEARDMTFAGTQFLTSAVTTSALSYARPLSLRLGPLPDQHFAVGATVKYMAGHGLIMGRDRSSTATTSPLEVTLDFPVVQSDTSLRDFGGAGSGWGVDVGASWQAGPFAVGATLQNAVNTFAWKVDEFYWRAGQATYTADSSTADFDTLRTMADAPEDVRASVTELRYAPVLAVGGTWTLSRRVMLVADARQRIGEGRMNAGEAMHVGAGVEYRALRFLPIRLGGSVVTGGYRLAGGLGIELGPLNVAASGGRRMGEGGSDGVAAFAVSFGTR